MHKVAERFDNSQESGVINWPISIARTGYGPSAIVIVTSGLRKVVGELKIAAIG